MNTIGNVIDRLQNARGFLIQSRNDAAAEYYATSVDELRLEARGEFEAYSRVLLQLCGEPMAEIAAFKPVEAA